MIDLDRLTTLIAYDASDNPEYIGKARTGSATSSGAWQIMKITYDVDGNPTEIEYASGETEFNKIWDDRASYSYS